MKLAELRSQLDSRKISAAELTEYFLKRIKDYDKIINSYITVCHESALMQAKEAQSYIDKGISMSLTGIPLSIKDNICTKGIKTTCASKMLSNFVPFYNAAAAERLLNQKSIILGKTNMDEFGMGDSGKTSYFGCIKNPHNVNHSAGGSSGGAAASVSLDLCCAALGTDTGGSVRQPASHCGVVGLRPTYGMISRFGLIAFASSLDQIGIIAKSSHDIGFILNSLCGKDEKDMTSCNFSDNFLSFTEKKLKGLKIGIAKELTESASDDVINAFYKSCDYFKANGAVLIEVSLPSAKHSVAAYYTISSAEAFSNLARYDGIKYGHSCVGSADYHSLITQSRNEGFGEEVRKRIAFGASALDSGIYKKASVIKNMIMNEYSKIFDTCDIIISPASPCTASLLKNPEQNYPDDICTVTQSLAGIPSISTPCGYDSNAMPIGLCISGKPFNDAKIIGIAHRFEQDFKRKTNY